MLSEVEVRKELEIKHRPYHDGIPADGHARLIIELAAASLYPISYGDIWKVTQPKGYQYGSISGDVSDLCKYGWLARTKAKGCKDQTFVPTQKLLDYLGIKSKITLQDIQQLLEKYIKQES